MIENYENLNVDETLDAVANFDGPRLEKFLEFEREHKGRTTVIKPLERKLLRVRPAVNRQYVAGIWFDNPNRWKLVRQSTRVTRAIDEGKLEVV